MQSLPPALLGAVVDRLALAVFVFRNGRLIYANIAAEALSHRVRESHRVELHVMLRDHVKTIEQLRSAGSPVGEPVAGVLMATNGEPFYVHVMPLGDGMGEVAVSVRIVGNEIEAFRKKYGLSHRETQVAELVLHGYKNSDIASTLGITPATTKKHLTRIFDKVGVDTRSQLQTRLS